MPSSPSGRHRRGNSALPVRSALLAMLATLAVLFGSGVAVVTLTAATAPPPDPQPTGVAAIGIAPTPTGTAGDEARSTPPASRGERATPPEPTTPPQEETGGRGNNGNGNGSGSGSGSGSGNGNGGSDDVAALEDQVTALTNAERATAGCGELSTDERLRTAARGHSQDMVDRDYFSHTSPDGDSPSDRARAAGYPSGVGENIAMGYRTPEDVMNGWMNSEGHRNNLLNCGYSVIGVGLAYDSRGRPYWTQKFGRS